VGRMLYHTISGVSKFLVLKPKGGYLIFKCGVPPVTGKGRVNFQRNLPKMLKV